MIEMKIKDVEFKEESGFVYCEDINGDMYGFPVNYSKARIIALLLTNAYAPKDTIYELLVKLINSSSLYIDSLVIEDGCNDKAAIYIGDTEKIKSFYVSIEDALILSLLANSKLYINKKAEFISEDELGQIALLKFLKELDLCC